MLDVGIRCPNCNRSIVKSGAQEIKMRTKLLIWREDGLFAVCKACTSDVPIDPDIFKAINAQFTFEVGSLKKSVDMPK